MYSPEFVQNWVKTTLLFSVEGISDEVSCIYTTASITNLGDTMYITRVILWTTPSCKKF